LLSKVIKSDKKRSKTRSAIVRPTNRNFFRGRTRRSFRWLRNVVKRNFRALHARCCGNSVGGWLSRNGFGNESLTNCRAVSVHDNNWARALTSVFCSRCGVQFIEISGRPGRLIRFPDFRRLRPTLIRRGVPGGDTRKTPRETVRTGFPRSANARRLTSRAQSTD